MMIPELPYVLNSNSKGTTWFQSKTDGEIVYTCTDDYHKELWETFIKTRDLLVQSDIRVSALIIELDILNTQIEKLKREKESLLMIHQH